MSRFMGWIGGTHTIQYHAHEHRSGMGPVYLQRYKSFPIQEDEAFPAVCRDVERNAFAGRACRMRTAVALGIALAMGSEAQQTL